MLGLTLYFTLPTFRPTPFQRIVMARDVYQARDSFTYAANFRILIVSLLTLIGILLLADNPRLNPKNFVDYFINHYSYPGIKGLIAVGIVAMAMSTADSILNTVTVLVINDIIKPLRKDFKESLVFIRLLACLIGFVGVCMALTTRDFLKLLLLSGTFFVPIITAPTLLAILGFRSSTRAA